MARIKGGIKKKEEETAYEKDMKKFKAQASSSIKSADLKGSISDKEYEFFLKLLNSKKK